MCVLSHYGLEHYPVIHVGGLRHPEGFKLRLKVRAANLLMEEYPLSKEFLTQVADNEWILETNVCNFEGVTRFILGLYEDVEIVESPEFKEFVSDRIRKMLPE